MRWEYWHARLVQSPLPKEDRFFGLFEQHAALVLAGAESLRAAIKGSADQRQALQTVSDRENDADAAAIIGLIAALEDSIDWCAGASREASLSPGS